MTAVSIPLPRGSWRAAPTHSSDYVFPAVLEFLRIRRGMRVLDVGCGNGHLVAALSDLGVDATGLDANPAALQVARDNFPGLPFVEGTIESVGEEAAGYDCVVSTEVIEHLYDPKGFVEGCHEALRPGGRIILSTPYHGYLKNVLIAASGKYDWHHAPWIYGGHIKFWSAKSLTTFLTLNGFRDCEVRGVGRYPYLWKSMVVAATKA